MTLLALALAATTAHALPLYEKATTNKATDECKSLNTMPNEGYVWTNFASNIGDGPVHIYLAEDFAEVFRTRPNSQGSITQDQARGLVQRAIEVWNRESRGPVLILEGESQTSLTTAQRLDSYCGSFVSSGGPDGMGIKEPAVLVSARDTDNKYGGLYMSQNKVGQWCHTWGHQIAALNIQRPPVDQLFPTLVHEFGHALGLAHSWGDNNESEDGPMSVMHYSTEDFDDALNTNTGSIAVVSADSLNNNHRGVWRSHLWPYDVDCVDDDLGSTTEVGQQDARRRELTYHWRVYSPEYHSWSTTSSDDSYVTGKTGTMGGMLEIDDMDSGPGAYALYHDASGGYGQGTITFEKEHWIEEGSFVDGYVEPDYFAHILSDEQASNVNISPHMFSAYETTDYADETDWSMYYNLPPLSTDSGDIAHSDIALMDPPPVHYQSGDAIGVDAYAGEVVACTPSSPCTLFDLDTEPVESHVAMRSTWDPVSEQTLYASVVTRACDSVDDFTFTDSNSSNACGSIRVYPGSTGLFAGWVLQSPTQLPPSAVSHLIYDQESFSASYDYTGTTLVAPAISCAPDATNASDGLSNCVLAWVDNGTPEGHILSTPFYVDGDEIVFGSAEPVNPYYHYNTEDEERDTLEYRSVYLQSQSDLDIMYSNGRFWMAYKNSAVGEEGLVSLSWTSIGDPEQWQYSETYLDERTAESPSWLHDPRSSTREAALVWSTTD